MTDQPGPSPSIGGRNEMEYYVEIRTWNGGVIKIMGTMSEHKSDKVDSGVNINLNHDEYYTAIVPAQTDSD